MGERTGGKELAWRHTLLDEFRRVLYASRAERAFSGPESILLSASQKISHHLCQESNAQWSVPHPQTHCRSSPIRSHNNVSQSFVPSYVQALG